MTHRTKGKKPEAFLYIGNDRIYSELRNTDHSIKKLNTDEIDRGQTLWGILCDYYEEGDIEREIDGYSVTPTQEFLRMRDMKLIGATDNIFVFALKLFGKYIWLVSSSVSTDHTIVQEEVQKMQAS